MIQHNNNVNSQKSIKNSVLIKQACVNRADWKKYFFCFMETNVAQEHEIQNYTHRERQQRNKTKLKDWNIIAQVVSNLRCIEF